MLLRLSLCNTAQWTHTYTPPKETTVRVKKMNSLMVSLGRSMKYQHNEYRKISDTKGVYC